MVSLDQKIDKIFEGGECLSKTTLKRRIKKLIEEERNKPFNPVLTGEKTYISCKELPYF